MRILIADSGGTKTDWLLSDGVDQRNLKTKGLNPNVFPEEQIRQVIAKEIVPWLGEESPDYIYFFGAGLGNTRNQNLMKNILVQELAQGNRKASISVESDLLGACYAAFGHSFGILAILGTGSVACMYDGNKIYKKTGGLGFILGDEGSGTALGKALIRSYLEDSMPKEIAREYREFVSLSQEDILLRIYQKEHVVDFLAHQSFFLAKHLDHPWIQRLISHQFEIFGEKYLKPLLVQSSSGMPIVFTGGIAERFFSFLISIGEAYFSEVRLMYSPIIEFLLKHIWTCHDQE